MISDEQLWQEYDLIRGEATRLAGGLGDLAQRAAVYHHLYEHSRGNHIFPLIAAHGALWAGNYFRFGLKLGRLMSWQYLFSKRRRDAAWQSINDFADAFRNVNRLVCIETYASYHFTKRFGDHPNVQLIIPEPLLSCLNQMHSAIDRGEQLSDMEKRQVFRAFFMNEQQAVVTPLIGEAVTNFDWPLMKWMALRPVISFAYLQGKGIKFRNFARQTERVRNGLEAFDRAAQVGWAQVESSLEAYETLPASFHENSELHFESLRTEVLLGAA